MSRAGGRNAKKMTQQIFRLFCFQATFPPSLPSRPTIRSPTRRRPSPRPSLSVWEAWEASWRRLCTDKWTTPDTCTSLSEYPLLSLLEANPLFPLRCSPGLWTTIGAQFLIIALCGILALHFKRVNRQLDEGTREPIEGVEGFRYSA